MLPRSIVLMLLGAAFCAGHADPLPESRTGAVTALQPRLTPDPLRTVGITALPPMFEENHGRTDPRFGFLATARGLSVRLSPVRVAIAGSGVEAELILIGADGNAQPAPPDSPPARVSYFRGRDPRAWIRNVPAHPRVRYKSVYPGIDVDWYGREGRLEFDFVVSPGADPGRIRLGVRGAPASIDRDGALVLGLPGNPLRVRPPMAYQEVNGGRRAVRAAWRRLRTADYGFDLGEYDPVRPLVIDPVLVYSSYIGASDGIAYAVGVSGSGEIYVAGETMSGAFGNGSLPKPPSGDSEGFVVKLDPTGSRLVYAAYLGGHGLDAVLSLAVDGAGNALVSGGTTSTDFPAVKAVQPKLSGSADAFVAKISAAGNELLLSTYLGGNATDIAFGVAADAAGAVYVVGLAQSATVLSSPAPGYRQNNAGGSDAFAVKLDADGRAVYATLLGGASGDEGRGAAVDAAGQLVLTGITHSADFPLANALYGAMPGAENVFVTKLNREGTGLVYSTYLNGPGGGDGIAVAVDAAGAAYVTGMAMSGFPTVNPIAPCAAAQAFLAKLSSDGSRLEYSTCLGESNTSGGSAVAVDSQGNAYVAGRTDSGDFPLVDGLQRKIGSSVVFKTSDAGATWHAADEGLLNRNVRSLIVDPLRPSDIYGVAAGGGVVKSSNRGTSWQGANSGLLSPPAVCGLASTGPSTLYTASDGTLYKTTDGAATWQPVGTGGFCVLAGARAPETLYVHSESGLKKSVDGGKTLTAIGAGIPGAAYPEVLAVDPSNPAVVYVGTSGFGAFKSTDGGATFTAMNVDSNVYAIAVAPSDSNVVYAGTRFGTYSSKDAGRTWNMPMSAIFDRVYALAVEPGNASVVYAGTRERGIHKSTDGGLSWRDVSAGITSPRIWTIAIDPSDVSRVYAGAVAHNDAFIAKIGPTGSQLLFSTFLGGMGNDEASGIALDPSGAIYIAGSTESADLPLISPRYSKLDDLIDAFVMKVSPGGGIGLVACTSGASFSPVAPVAPNSIATLWGKQLAPSAAWASSLPLPVELAGARLKVSDSAGVERFAQLFFVSPDQVNFLVPEGTRTGTASLTALRDGVIVGMGTVQITELAPALFTANSSGRGVPAATAVRVSATAVQTPVRVYDCPSGGGSCAPAPLDLGNPTDQLILVLYGTGIRGKPAGANTIAAIGGIQAMVLYAGPQADVGVDQVNVLVPRTLAGRGEVELELAVGGMAANKVTIAVK